MERLAGIIPPPWRNLVRYGGIFAPGHAWRASVVPGSKRRVCRDDGPPPLTTPSNGRAPAEYSIPWADLLRRTFGIRPEICDCGGKMKVLESVTTQEGITEMMVKMGLSALPPPRGRARRQRGELDYVFTDE